MPATPAPNGTAATGYPNLQDDDWLRIGIRSGRAETRAGEMPASGRDGIPKRDEVETVANYVLFNPG